MESRRKGLFLPESLPVLLVLVSFCLFPVKGQPKKTLPRQTNISEPSEAAELEKAIRTMDSKKIKRMLMGGMDPSIQTPDGKETALHWAAMFGNLDIFKLALKKGARVNVEDKNQFTPLHRVFFNVDEDTLEELKMLLDRGAKVNAKNKRGETALHLAVETYDIDSGIIKLLLDRGADPNIPNGRNKNALQLANYYEREDLVELLKPLVKNRIEETRAKLPGKFFKRGKIELYYEIHGAERGTPLFVLHGGPGFNFQYFFANSVFAEIWKNRPVVFYDQRGSGFSTELTVNQTANVEDFVEDLEALRKFLGYEKIDVFGHSWGGFLAMAYTAAHQNAVAHLIISDSFAPNYNETEDEFKLYYPQEYEEMGSKRFTMSSSPQAQREYYLAYMKMLFHSPEKRDAFITGAEKYTANDDVNRKANDSASKTDLTGPLAKVVTPTLIIHGKYDANITLAAARKINAAIAKSQLVVFEESGHLPFYEEPEKFIKEVTEFLK